MNLAAGGHMQVGWIQFEPYIRFGAFVIVFLTMALWEVLAPRRQSVLGRGKRWPGNIGVFLLDMAVVRVVAPAGVVGFALWTEPSGHGFLNAVPVPYWLAVPLAVVGLDLVVYLQHRLFHAVPALWRLHRMHHADLEFDVTTGNRFHPLEILASFGIKLAAVSILGAPALAVLMFEVLLNASSMFNHANARLSDALDRQLRRWIVTPDMHRVHHSILMPETNSNFGFCLPWWDFVFGTYRAAPAAGHTEMTIGVPGFANPSEQRLDRLLTQPFRNGTSNQDASRHR